MFCKNCGGRTPVNSAAGNPCIEECGSLTARRGFQICASCSQTAGKCEACASPSLVKGSRRKPRALERRADYARWNRRRSRSR